MTTRPLLCDFCDAATEAGFTFEHGPFQLFDPVKCQLLDVEPGKFFGCDLCAELFEAGRLDELVERVTKALDAPHMRRKFRSLFGEVQKHHVKTARVSIADMEPAARFYKSKCPKCGRERTIDSASYDRVKSYVCECGLNMTLIGRASLKGAS